MIGDRHFAVTVRKAVHGIPGKCSSRKGRIISERRNCKHNGREKDGGEGFFEGGTVNRSVRSFIS